MTRAEMRRVYAEAVEEAAYYHWLLLWKLARRAGMSDRQLKLAVERARKDVLRLQKKPS